MRRTRAARRRRGRHVGRGVRLVSDYDRCGWIPRRYKLVRTNGRQSFRGSGTRLARALCPSFSDFARRHPTTLRMLGSSDPSYVTSSSHRECYYYVLRLTIILVTIQKSHTRLRSRFSQGDINYSSTELYYLAKLKI